MNELKPIGILLPAGINYCIAMLAALKSGVGFVPLDITYPIDRLNFIIKTCQIKKIVTDLSFRAIYERLGVQEIIFCDQKNSAKLESSKKANCSASSVAYIVFTSGTTGSPKGIAITHENVLPLMLWQRQHFKIDQSTKMAQTLSLTFDFGIQEVLTTLLFGGTLVIPDPKQRLTSQNYVQFLNENLITTLYTTPTHLTNLINTGNLFSLEYILVGGEKFEVTLFHNLKEKVSTHCKIINGYGPSEVSINVAMYFAKTTSTFSMSHSLPIGSPSANNKIYILDSDYWPVPNQVPGEIFLGGQGVTHGYINHPAGNESSFLKHPFLNLGRLYKTGDYGYFLDDNIVFTQRLDSQHKINGYRIELSEIKIQLECIPQIKQVHVALIDFPAVGCSSALKRRHELNRITNMRCGTVCFYITNILSINICQFNSA